MMLVRGPTTSTSDGDVPDIALEVILTHGAIDKLDVYRGLGVREVWIFEAGAFRVLTLRGDRYEVVARSEVFARGRPRADRSPRVAARSARGAACVSRRASRLTDVTRARRCG
jgi:Uma2 family endonuclease